MSTTLYPELVTYIFEYRKEYMDEKEYHAFKHHIAMEKLLQGGKVEFYTRISDKHFLHITEESKNLLSDGYELFKEKVAIRIFNEHKDQLNLNLCPKCFKIARTPQAKQCRFCFYDWH